jgi:hypothetical protein
MKNDMGARKMQWCILLKSRLAVLNPAVKRSRVLTRMQNELPMDKTNKQL